MDMATMARAIKELAWAKETVLTMVMEMGTSTGMVADMATRGETATETAGAAETEMERNTAEPFAREFPARRPSPLAKWNRPSNADKA
jgi:hypothetical protein